MEKQTENQKEKFIARFGKFHDKYYKILLVIPLLILILGIVFMSIFYAQNNDFVYRDISLTGGTSITISDKIPAEKIKQDLSGKLQDINTREIYELTTREQKAIIIETTEKPEPTKQILEDYLGYELTKENSSIRFTGSSLSESFYKQLLIAILIAFVFMAIVVFIIFRTTIPSLAVLISAFADLFMTLVFVNVLGMKMSTAGIVAFLMLIGYSVDTDILLTNRILKRHQGNLNERIFSAFKTGTTMTLTSLIAIAIALIIVSSFSKILTHIFSILVIGLSFDLLNTWITNVSIIKWYVLKK